MIAVIATVCFTGISLIAGTTDDKTVKTEKKTESVVSENEKDNSGTKNLGPLVKGNVTGIRCDRDGNYYDFFAPVFDIYYATDECKSYVAKRQTNGYEYPVYENRSGGYCGRYYAKNGDDRYYFDL